MMPSPITPTVAFFAEAMLFPFESERGAQEGVPMTLRRVPSKRLSRGAPIAYVPRGKETSE
jgi:hypothetical protein